MHLVKIKNGLVEKFPYFVQELKKYNPNISFPKNMSESLLNEFGVYTVTVLDIPEYDSYTQTPEMQGPELINGVWTISWIINDKSIDDATKLIKQKRDMLLYKTDWTANSDVIMTPEMETYRQALRDITLQTDFPYNVTWPIKP